MSLFLMSFPQAVIKQATAPEASAGTLWWDTDDLLLYYYTGVSWLQISSSSDAAGWEQAVAQITLEVLRLSAEGTLTAPDYDNMFVDYFSDSSGQDNTINTGAGTTATFATDKYQNFGGGNDAYTWTTDGNDDPTGKAGAKIHANSNCYLNSVTLYTGVTATKIRLENSSNVLIASADVVDGVGTFSTPQALTSGTNYYIKLDSNGAAYHRVYKASGSYPQNRVYVNYTSGISGDSENAGAYNFSSASFYAINPSAKIVLTNAQALSFAPSYILIHNKDKTLTGAGTLTFDVSFDGGSTWDSTGNNFDEKVVVVDGSSKNMIVKMHLTGTTEQSFKDYEVILWSS